MKYVEKIKQYFKKRKELKESIKQYRINNCRWYYSNKKMKSMVFSNGMGYRGNVDPLKIFMGGVELKIVDEEVDYKPYFDDAIKNPHKYKWLSPKPSQIDPTKG